MDIRALVFNSGTYERSDLSRKSDQELWELYVKDDDMAQVQCFTLDELSCAFNDEEISDQDWLYFVDLDNIETEQANINKEKADKMIDFMSEWDSDTVITILQTYVSNESLADLYNTLVSEGVIDEEYKL